MPNLWHIVVSAQRDRACDPFETSHRVRSITESSEERRRKKRANFRDAAECKAKFSMRNETKRTEQSGMVSSFCFFFAGFWFVLRNGRIPLRVAIFFCVESRVSGLLTFGFGQVAKETVVNLRRKEDPGRTTCLGRILIVTENWLKQFQI